VVLRRAEQGGQDVALAAAALPEADVGLQPARIGRAVQGALVQLDDSEAEILRRGEEGGGDAVGAAPRLGGARIPGGLGVAATAAEDLDVEAADVVGFDAGGDEGGGDGAGLAGLAGPPPAALRPPPPSLPPRT